MSDDKINKNPGCSSAFKSDWTCNEKFLLLKSLRLYGHKNITAISTLLSNKSQDDIKATINHLKSRSKVVKINTSLINDWMGSKVIKKKSMIIKQVLLFISLFDKNSISTSPSGNRIHDYREIYRYLYNLSCGTKNVKLSKPNQDILYKALTEIEDKITSTTQQDIMLHLEKLINQNKNIKTYPAKKKLLNK